MMPVPPAWVIRVLWSRGELEDAFSNSEFKIINGIRNRIKVEKEAFTRCGLGSLLS